MATNLWGAVLRDAVPVLEVGRGEPSIGTPLDVTAEEVHIETHIPADDETEATLRALR